MWPAVMGNGEEVWRKKEMIKYIAEVCGKPCKLNNIGVQHHV
jgi:hypothetical protein